MIHETRDASADAFAGAPDHEAVEAPAGRDAMIGLMRRYRRVKREREEAEANGAAYVAQVREEVRRDVAPMKEHEERLREAMLVFVRDHNEGASFKVPGLGCAHTQSRTTTEILDRDALVAHLKSRDPEALTALYDVKLNDARAKKLAQARVGEDGEVLPGTDTRKTETLVVKLA